MTYCNSARPNHAPKLLALVLSLVVVAGVPGSVRAHDDESYGAKDVYVLTAAQVKTRTGRSIDQWAARWWQWAYDHPEVLGDSSGEFAALGNVGGPVYFAEGSTGDPTKIEAVVPSGQYVLLPVATYLWTFFDPCAEVACAREIVNANFLDRIPYANVRIDGERVPNMWSHRVQLDAARPLVFKVDAGPIQEDGYGGILDAVQSGYWIMLAPLPPGKHHIVMTAAVPNLDPFTGELLEGYSMLDARLKLSVRSRNR